MKWYLSFVEDHKFLGACIVEADSLENAIRKAWLYDINPGGSVCAIPFTKETKLPMYKLMTRAEMELFGPTIRYGDSSVQQIGLN